MINGWNISSVKSSSNNDDDEVGVVASSSSLLLPSNPIQPASKDSITPIKQDRNGGSSRIVVGRIQKDIPTGRWSREFVIQKSQQDNGENPQRERGETIKSDGGDSSSTYIAKIIMNAEKYPLLKPWMSIRNARKLLVPGVSIAVTYYHCLKENDNLHHDKKNDDTQDDEGISNYYHATKIQIVGALPATPYLSRLLNFSPKHLNILFGNTNNHNDDDGTKSTTIGQDDNDSIDSFWVPLACAVRPCSVVELQDLLTMIQQQTAKDKENLFKHPKLLKICDDIRQHQGWSRGPQKKPCTPHYVWLALLRMEEQWLRRQPPTTKEINSSTTSNGGGTHDNNDHTSVTNDNHDRQDVENALDEAPPTKTRRTELLPPPSPHSHSPKDQKQLVSYGGINVDPSFNVPDPTDLKRMSYIDQRKRPQVLWMVDFIHQLIRKTEKEEDSTGHTQPKDLEEVDIMESSLSSPPKLHLIDIGGGRGDLAVALAASFTQTKNKTEPRRDVHVTVLDVNQSSLQAGQKRAQDANLESYMSFRLCDITDRKNVMDIFLSTKENTNYFVYGLHCCGGLSEAAVDLALTLGAKYFCVSTCCFRSNDHLACLSKLADTMASSSSVVTKVPKMKTEVGLDNNGDETMVAGKNSQYYSEQVEHHIDDRDMVSSLAVLVGSHGQHRGIHVLNDMRLTAAKYKCQLEGKYTLKCWQEAFPVKYSVQNRILVGTLQTNKP